MDKQDNTTKLRFVDESDCNTLQTERSCHSGHVQSFHTVVPYIARFRQRVRVGVTQALVQKANGHSPLR